VYSDFYEIPLPALRFEKVEETHREVNDTEENDARPRQKYKQKEKKPGKDHSIKKTPKKPHSRNDASNTENNTQGTLTLPETKLRQ